MTDADAPSAASEPAATADNANAQPDTILGWPADEDLSGIIRDVDVIPNLYEHRIPECGAACPPGLNDPISRELIDTVRWFLLFLTRTFWSPASLARLERVWQWRKFDFLDGLRPVELLLRRLLLIEALGLILSQALPPMRAVRAGKQPASVPRSKPPFDPDHPETWRVSFNVIPGGRPGASRRRLRRRLPPIDRNRVRCHPVTPLRYRRVVHNAAPLARRLEAAIRVTLDPGRYAWRLALRLQRRRNPNASLLLIPRGRPFPRPAPRETLVVAGDRAAALHHDWWSSA